jgi:hypothetical protein
MKKNIKELEVADIDDILERVESDYNAFEHGFLQLF